MDFGIFGKRKPTELISDGNLIKNTKDSFYLDTYMN
jgi:hypothetical protein